MVNFVIAGNLIKYIYAKYSSDSGEPVLAQPHQSLLLGQGLAPAPSPLLEFSGYLESGCF